MLCMRTSSRSYTEQVQCLHNTVPWQHLTMEHSTRGPDTWEGVLRPIRRCPLLLVSEAQQHVGGHPLRPERASFSNTQATVLCEGDTEGLPRSCPPPPPRGHGGVTA